MAKIPGAFKNRFIHSLAQPAKSSFGDVAVMRVIAKPEQQKFAPLNVLQQSSDANPRQNAQNAQTLSEQILRESRRLYG